MADISLTYLINKVDYGGAEIGMLRLLSGLDPRHFDCTVVVLKGINSELADDLPAHAEFHPLSLHQRPNMRSIRRLWGIIDSTDVLVSSLFPSIMLGSLGGALANVPESYVWRHNTPELSRPRKLLNRLSIRLADGVFVDSMATEQLVIDWGVPPADVHLLPLAGVDVDKFPAVSHRSGSSTTRVGTIGRLVEQKGYPELLDCAARLPEYEFHVVGDGPLAPRMADGPTNVIMHGAVTNSELFELLETIDVYFQPSRYEGLCITAIEAMAGQLPVVASAVDGLTESIVDGKTGYLVPQGDIDGYCRRINTLATDPERRQRFGEAGRNRVRSNYSQEALAASFIEAIGLGDRVGSADRPQPAARNYPSE